MREKSKKVHLYEFNYLIYIGKIILEGKENKKMPFKKVLNGIFF